MATTDYRQFGIARLYARAILEVTEEQGASDQVLEELGELDRLFATDDSFAAFLASPLVDAEDRRATVEKLLRGKASDLVVDAVQVINRKGRLGLLPLIAEAYRREHQALAGVVDVHVETAVELTESLRERLRRTADKLTGKRTNLIEKVDPTLLGGLVVRVDDEKFDASVARSLALLGARLAERATHEILKAKEQTAAESAPEAR